MNDECHLQRTRNYSDNAICAKYARQKKNKSSRYFHELFFDAKSSLLYSALEEQFSEHKLLNNFFVPMLQYF